MHEFHDLGGHFNSLLLQAKSSAQRFKVTSQLRCLQEGCGSSGGGDSCSPVTGDGEIVAAAAATASGPTGVKIHICDVHQEDSAVEDWSVATSSRSLLLSDCSSNYIFHKNIFST